MSKNRVPAPKVNPVALWQMSPKAFNEWREKNDYPRIVKYFKENVASFNDWMLDQHVSEESLIKYSPSTFLEEDKILYLCAILDEGTREVKESLLHVKYEVNAIIPGNNRLTERVDIMSYPLWFTQKMNKRAPEFMINMREGRSCYMFSELELLDLGSCTLASIYPIGSRKVDFLNINDLQIINCMNNTSLKVWFCSARNLTIQNDLPFLDAYKSEFYESFNEKTSNLKLINGRFQSWVFKDCQVNVALTNSIMHLWKFSGFDFGATLSNSDIRNCSFTSSKIKYPIHIGHVKEFHAHLKRLYSQIGKRKEASNHYYLEKTYERKSFLHIKENYQQEYYRAKGKLAKGILRINFMLKYLVSGFLNILWGYGERPSRVFGISICSILMFALIYCFHPNSSSSTHHDFINSLYYSMVTFTTLGYGDINQTGKFLRLASGMEALLGMTFWGILIAGFTSNSKDY